GAGPDRRRPARLGAPCPPPHLGAGCLMVERITRDGRLGQVDATVVPRFAGSPTFARLPRIDEVSDVDVAVLGVPFDSGVSYRPGARFGPGHVRESSRLLRPYNPAQDTEPFA